MVPTYSAAVREQNVMNSQYCQARGLLQVLVRNKERTRAYYVIIQILFSFYGMGIYQSVQVPGEVLYIPHGLPHTIHNIDSNIALTSNQLFRVRLYLCYNGTRIMGQF